MTLFRSGWLRIGSFHGAPIRVHWTLPLGAWVLTGLSWVPGAWLGFVLLVLVHEIGHAVLVRAFGLRVVRIDVHGIGGECPWTGVATERAKAAIAWGGVLAQVVVLVTTPVWGDRLPRPTPPFFEQLVSTFTGTNVMLMLLNLLPIAPLDGATAWRLFLPPSPKKVALHMRARSIQRQLDQLAKEREDEDEDEDDGSGPRRIDRSKLN